MNDVKSILLREEGISLFPYKCPAGFMTIGVGHNLEAHPLPPDMQALVDGGHPITDEMAFKLLAEDIARAQAQAEQFTWFHLLTINRQAVIVCMVFQIGFGGVRAFRKMLQALDAGDNDEAARQMLDSRWAVQTPLRAKRMAKLMREG